MTNQLDERIDYHQSMDWVYRHGMVRNLFRSAQYHRPIESPGHLGSGSSIATVIDQYHCPMDSARHLWFNPSCDRADAAAH